MKVLHLPAKKKWYNMQESGEKPEEYREITPYWCNRLLYVCPLGIKKYWEPALEKTFRLVRELGARYHDSYSLQQILVHEMGIREYTHVLLRYGYTKRCFMHRIDSITIGRGKVEWGAPPDRDVFIIKHHEE